jgi:cathepsin C
MNFLSSLGPATSLRVSLTDPDAATTEEGGTGTWTMIYDEGFEVAVGDQVYFAFSKFDFVDSGNKEKTNVSHCDQTEIGWYHNTARNQWGCYSGRKVSSSGGGAGTSQALPAEQAAPPAAAPPSPPSRPGSRLSLSTWAATDQFALAPDQDDSTDPPAAQEDDEDDASEQTQFQASAAPASTTPPPAFQQQPLPTTDTSILTDITATPQEYKPWVPDSAGYDKPMPNDWQKAVADALNFLQLGWSARPYNMFAGKTPRELNRFAGVRRSRSKPQHRGQGQQPELTADFSSFLGLGSRVRRGSGLDSFDWRDRRGQNWLQPIVTQGDCGSCYAISTVHMLTARNRIRQGDASLPAFSVSFPLHCSEYNQGCDGGYGFLESKWNEDVGLVPESCAPLREGDGQCQALPDCDLGEKRYRATNHHYVGGFYGGSDAEAIKQELVNYGPLVMSFEPKEDFMYYKSGIYRSGPNKIHQEWEQVDHAVLLAGFGEENGQAYWTLQNSWGNDWGEDGYFRMARGIDESGCESIAVAAEVTEESSNEVLDDFLASL